MSGVGREPPDEKIAAIERRLTTRSGRRERQVSGAGLAEPNDHTGYCRPARLNLSLELHAAASARENLLNHSTLALGRNVKRVCARRWWALLALLGILLGPAANAGGVIVVTDAGAPSPSTCTLAQAIAEANAANGIDITAIGSATTDVGMCAGGTIPPGPGANYIVVNVPDNDHADDDRQLLVRTERAAADREHRLLIPWLCRTARRSAPCTPAIRRRQRRTHSAFSTSPAA